MDLGLTFKAGTAVLAAFSLARLLLLLGRCIAYLDRDVIRAGELVGVLMRFMFGRVLSGWARACTRQRGHRTVGFKT